MSARADRDRSDATTGTIQIVEDLTVERWIHQLAECFPDRRAVELPAIATAIWGVNRAIVQRSLLGKLDMDERATIRFMIRWTLRALEVPEREIASIVRSCLRARGPRKASRKRS